VIGRSDDIELGLNKRIVSQTIHMENIVSFIYFFKEKSRYNIINDISNEFPKANGIVIGSGNQFLALL